jgi:hypothetical protein
MKLAVKEPLVNVNIVFVLGCSRSLITLGLKQQKL